MIVIEHQDDDGNLFYSRYAHVNHLQFPVVRKNDPVTIGRVIAHIGNADGIYGSGHHLHFDMSHTKVLKSQPGHWPGDVSEMTIRRNYSEPCRFIFEHRNATAPVFPSRPSLKRVIATRLRIRPQPNTLEPEIAWLSYGNQVEVSGSISGSGYHFAQLHTVNRLVLTMTKRDMWRLNFWSHDFLHELFRIYSKAMQHATQRAERRLIFVCMLSTL